MPPADLLIARPQGLYCPAGDFYIDPCRPVERAVITHAHADHARGGHRHYLCAKRGADVLRARLGHHLPLQTLDWGEVLEHGGVRVSLHPAGHVLGSAQVRLQLGARVWVVSGDYFVGTAGDLNPSCDPFEPQVCECFVTESTFALPVYRWAPQRQVLSEIARWWQGNAADGHASLLLAYSLGKAQRLLAGLPPGLGPLVVHPSLEPINTAYRAAGVTLPTTFGPADLSPADLSQALVIAPPNVMDTPWTARLGPVRSALASGWMQTRAMRRQRSAEHGFALSDHADWPGLLQAIRATGAERVIAHHGQPQALVRWLTEQGWQAQTFDKAAD